MYFNDIHIIIYLVVGLLGCLAGQLVGMLNNRFANHKEIFSKQAFKEMKIAYEPHYIFMALISIIYIILLYVIGIDIKNWYANIDLIAYFLLIPMLVSAFSIDLKYEIIPNRLVINMLEIGLITTFANGIFNPNGTSIAFDRITGLFVGGGIFLLITIIGGLIAGKEAMGMGDVKFVGTLGLFFGIKNILMISVMSLFIGAILSILIIVFKIKKPNEDIPFGPFIVVSTFIAIFTPETVLFNVLWFIFSGEWFMKLIYR